MSNVVSNGEEPSVPEELGKLAAQRLLQEIYFGGIADSTSQAIAIVCMALGQKDVSKIVLGPLTEYSIALLQHLRDFFGITFKLTHCEEEDGTPRGASKVLLTCVGIGYSNLSKRVI